MNISAIANQNQCFPGHGVFQTLRFDELVQIEVEYGECRDWDEIKPIRLELDPDTQERLDSYRRREVQRDNLYRQIMSFNLAGAYRLIAFYYEEVR